MTEPTFILDGVQDICQRRLDDLDQYIVALADAQGMPPFDFMDSLPTDLQVQLAQMVAGHIQSQRAATVTSTLRPLWSVYHPQLTMRELFALYHWDMATHPTTDPYVEDEEFDRQLATLRSAVDAALIIVRKEQPGD